MPKRQNLLALDSQRAIVSEPGAHVHAWTAITGTPATFPPESHDHDSRYYTESEITALLAGYSPTTHNHTGVYAAANHTHDDRYYTETEITALLAGYSPTSHLHTGVYAAASHDHDSRYYTETEITALLAGYSPTSHLHTGVYAAASHDHDSRYYTETESDARFGRLASSNTWSAAQQLKAGALLGAPVNVGSYGSIRATYNGDEATYGVGASIDFRRPVGNYGNEGEIRFATHPGANGVVTPLDRMVIDRNGNVGIGTASPSGLTVTAAVSETALGTDNIRFGVTSGTPRIFLEDNTYVQWQIDNYAGNLRFFNPGAVRMTIDNDGRVGIGSSPQAGYTLSVGGNILMAGGGNFYRTGGSLDFYVDGGNVIRYLDSGGGGSMRVGYGVTPTKTLHVLGDFDLRNSSGDGAAMVTGGMNVGLTSIIGTPSMLYFRSNGVGVGTETPSKRLHVLGSIVVDGDENGVAGAVTLCDSYTVAANSTGVGTIKMKGTTSRDSAGFLKIYLGETPYYIPVFSAYG